MLPPAKVAEICRVSRKTVCNWCDDSLLVCTVMPSGHRRIAADDLVTFMRKNKLPAEWMPAELRPK